MRKFLIPLAAVAALAASAAPAAAQTWRGDQNDNRGYSQHRGDTYDRGDDNGYGQNRGHGGQQTTGYVERLEWKINTAAREGRISRGEARALLAELRQLQPIAWRVQTGQANGWEQRRLSQGVNRIETAVNSDRYAGRNDRYERGEDYGYRR